MRILSCGDEPRTQLLPAVRPVRHEILKGHYFAGVPPPRWGLLAPTVTRRLIEGFTRRPEPRSLAGVTDRERDVLCLVARGLSNGEIAERLHVSMATVKSHVGRLLAKLQARDRAQLVIAAYEAGLAE
jgi:DNA-binding NarL/FixJ family response regulator